MSEFLTIALPKGKLGLEAIEKAEKAGLPTRGLSTDSRQLVQEYENQKVRYLICRSSDVPTYVEYGAADLGVVGKDTIVETNADVFELLDLKFGYCKFVVALPREVWLRKQKLELFNHKRVATKFPRVAGQFFEERGMQMEVIKLHGNIELAPQVGLAEMIVDIVSTGRTLRENDLVAVEDIFESTARLIANRVSYRLNHLRLQRVVNNFREVVLEEEKFHA